MEDVPLKSEGYLTTIAQPFRVKVRPSIALAIAMLGSVLLCIWCARASDEGAAANLLIRYYAGGLFGLGLVAASIAPRQFWIVPIGVFIGQLIGVGITGEEADTYLLEVCAIAGLNIVAFAGAIVPFLLARAFGRRPSGPLASAGATSAPVNGEKFSLQYEPAQPRPVPATMKVLGQLLLVAFSALAGLALVYSVLIVLLSVGIGSLIEQATAPGPWQPPPWYFGGTLQKATLKEWREATVENRLATASDLVVTTAELRSGIGYGDREDSRPEAVELVREIDELAAEVSAVDHRTVAETFAALHPPPWSGHLTQMGTDYMNDDNPRTGIVWLAEGQDVWLPVDSAAQYTMYGYRNNRDEDGIRRLHVDGRMFTLKAGTAVTVTDWQSGFTGGGVTVEVQEGPHVGGRGIIAREEYHHASFPSFGREAAAPGLLSPRTTAPGSATSRPGEALAPATGG